VAIGELDRLPEAVSKVLANIIKKTSGNDRMVLNLALSYGSRNELARAVQSLGRAVDEGKLLVEDLTEEAIDKALDTSALPDPDLVIRTSGEMRISNFLLWQLAYAELYFTDAFWPDFSRELLLQAIEEYSNRQRRFGLTASQLLHENPENGEGRH
jgi:undecaprenyl diphosphate synthase